MNKSLKSLGLALLLSLPLASLAADVEWITDKRGCKVANIYPQEGESIAWNGACKDNYAHGQGKLTWYMNGVPRDVYEGSLVRGWAEGKGKLTRKDGVYTGEWKNSLQHGQGRYEHNDGSWYEGAWEDGHPHGHGQMRTPDGKLFSGTWYRGEYEDERSPSNRT